MIDMKKKQTDLNEVRKQMRAKEAQETELRKSSK